MSVIESFYNKTFSVIRRASGVGIQSQQMIASTISTGNKCCIRIPTRGAADAGQTYTPGTYGNEYWMYCEESIDIKVADIIQVGSIKYVVKGVSFFEDEEDGSESHLKVTMSKPNANNEPMNP